MPQAERITREPREAEEPQQGKWILPDHLMSLNILDVCRYMEEKKKKPSNQQMKHKYDIENNAMKESIWGLGEDVT